MQDLICLSLSSEDFFWQVFSVVSEETLEIVSSGEHIREVFLQSQRQTRKYLATVEKVSLCNTQTYCVQLMGQIVLKTTKSRKSCVPQDIGQGPQIASGYMKLQIFYVLLFWVQK